jgi:hypothetical protein
MTDQQPALIVIDGEILTGTQAELLYKAICRAAGELGQRVAENRYDEEAVELLADASRITKLLYAAVPKKPKPAKPPPGHDD